MAWALQFDGVNDYATLASTVNLSGDFELNMRFKFSTVAVNNFLLGNSSNTGVWVGWFNNSFTARLLGVTMSLPTDPSAGVWYDIKIKRVSGSITFSEPLLGSVSGVESGSIPINQLGRYSTSTSLIFAGQLEYLTVDLATTPTHNLDATTSSHSAGTVTLTDTIGGNNATGVNMPTDGSAWVDLGGGGLTVTGTTPTFNYSSIAASIDLTGSIDITGQTANYTYSSVGGAVDLTGDISVTGATASYNYQSINGVVDLTGEITVLGSTPSQSYSSVNGIIELGAVISVVGLTPNYNYQGIAGEVSLNGEILVSGETPSYSYSAIKGFITTGEAQVIGTVTSSFASDVYSSGFKPSTITVNFKS